MMSLSFAITTPHDGFSYTVKEWSRGFKVFFSDTFLGEESSVQTRLDIIEEIHMERSAVNDTYTLRVLGDKENKYQIEVQQRINQIDDGQTRARVMERFEIHKQRLQEILEVAPVSAQDGIKNAIYNSDKNRDRVRSVEVNLVDEFHAIGSLPFDYEVECEKYGGTLFSETNKVGCFDATSVINVEMVRNYPLYDVAEEKCKELGGEVVLDIHNIGCEY